MCSEAVCWSCRRALVSDYLKVEGWTVMHIIGHWEGPAAPIYFTRKKNISGRLSYEV